ncbi:hypothetical protein scyTo_0015233 [Scyliorhinus torazame]|uniref:Uncharacterized protein n=1 Tax=Scyliorhinus torazame TaxID=75743 RepID=A0A401P694_SCYTO|nr:hypothetical protein [Scyliorhinus torazame]
MHSVCIPEIHLAEWDEKGKAVIVNAKVYEEEMKLYGELLPELKNYQRKQRRMLYQYINFDNPEFNVLTTTEIDQKEQTIQENISENKTKVPVPSHPTAQTAALYMITETVVLCTKLIIKANA